MLLVLWELLCSQKVRLLVLAKPELRESAKRRRRRSSAPHQRLLWRSPTPVEWVRDEPRGGGVFQ